MENASKALLIAGTILIVILLIAIGMLIYSKSRDTIDTGVQQMDSSEIQLFNAQFQNYEGKQDINGIKQLVGIIISNDLTYEDEPQRQVGLGFAYSLGYHNHGKGTIKNDEPIPVGELYSIKKVIDEGVNKTQMRDDGLIFNVYLCYRKNGLIKNILIIQKGTSYDDPSRIKYLISELSD